MLKNVKNDKDEKDEDAVLVCAMAHEDRAVPGAEIITADCGHQVIIAPSGREAVAAGAKTRCIDCIGGYAAVLQLAQEAQLNVTSATRREVEGAMGVAAATSFMERHNIQEVDWSGPAHQ